MEVFAIKTFFTTLRKNKIPFVGFFLFYIATSFVISATYIGSQIITGEMGQATYQLDAGLIIKFLLIFTGVMVVRIVFRALNTLLSQRYTGTAEYKFRVNFANFYLRQPFAKFEKTNSGKNLSVFTNDLPQAVQLVSGGAFTMILGVIELIVAMAYMFYMNWLYTLIFIATFPVLVLIQTAISTPIKKTARKVMETRSDFNAIVNDSLQNISTVIAYDLEEELESRYLSAYKKYFAFGMREIFLKSTTRIAGNVTSTLPLVYLYIISGFAVVNETMLISDFIIFTGLGLMAASWLMGLGNILSNVRVWAAGAVRLNEFTTGDPENVGEEQSVTIRGKSAVTFTDISFAYAIDAPDALSNVTFEITLGKKVAIVGGSGSGKSTTLKLMLGLYEPKSGMINVLGNDTKKIGKYALRDAFAYVPQDSFLFPVSIGENITCKKEITLHEQAKLEKACRDAGILDFINSLPDAFDSMLSESAENISGGQRQRIAMARAFYKDAPIILFDEATSSLDPTTEAEILKSLEDATKDTTVIMATHRAAAKAFCDTVIALEGGRLE